MYLGCMPPMHVGTKGKVQGARACNDDDDDNAGDFGCLVRCLPVYRSASMYILPPTYFYLTLGKDPDCQVARQHGIASYLLQLALLFHTPTSHQYT